MRRFCLGISRPARPSDPPTDFQRIHQLAVPNKAGGIDYTIDVSKNVYSGTVFVDGKSYNLKTKSKIDHELHIANRVLSGHPFVPKHTVMTKLPTDIQEKLYSLSKLSNPKTMVRLDLSIYSFADIYGILKTGDMTKIFDEVSRSKLHNGYVFKHACKRPFFNCQTPECRKECRQSICNLGIFFLRLYNQVYSVAELLISRGYTGCITADNVDISEGVLDFEDFQQVEKSKLPDVTVMMEPFLEFFWRMYNALGCNIITQPIFAKDDDFTKLFDIIDDRVNNPDPNNTTRMPFKTFLEFFSMEEYVQQECYENLVDLPRPNFEKETRINLLPRSHLNDYEPLEPETKVEIGNYYIVDYCNLRNVSEEQLSSGGIIYVKNHPDKKLFERWQDSMLTQMWVKFIYEGAVHTSYFPLAEKALSEKINHYPIIGKTVASELDMCENPECKQIPQHIRDTVSLCSATKLLTCTTKTQTFKNPCYEYQNPFSYYGDCTDEYDSKTRYKAQAFINYELIEFAKKRGLDLLIPPEIVDETIHDPSNTYGSNMFIMPVTDEELYKDLHLYDGHNAGSISLSLFKLAYWNAHDKIAETFLVNGVPNTVRDVTNIPVRKKNASPGLPYINIPVGSPQLRRLAGDYMNIIARHKRHDTTAGISRSQAKIAPSGKNRLRTVIGLPIFTTMVGRHFGRYPLDKMMAAAKNNGPIALGVSAQKGEFERVHIYGMLKDFDLHDKVKHGCVDFPGWDRRISNLMQLAAMLMTISTYDMAENQRYCTLEELLNIAISDSQGVMFDYIVQGTRVYTKPGGVTSGNSHTADGNSYMHYILCNSAMMTELAFSNSENFNLYRKERNEITQKLFTRPGDLIKLSDETNKILYNNIYRPHILSDDGVVLHDSRVIDFYSAMQNIEIFSCYIIPRSKLSLTDLMEGYHEFISGYPKVLDDKWIVTPDFNKVYGSIMLTANQSGYDPSIFITRHIALAFYMYKAKLLRDKYWSQFYDVYIDFICEHKIELSSNSLSQIAEYIGCDEITDQLSVTRESLEKFFKELHGIDNNLPTLTEIGDCVRHVETKPQAMSTLSNYFCVICGLPPQYRCRVCDVWLCNNVNDDESHIYQHYTYANHKADSYFCVNPKPTSICCEVCFTSLVPNLRISNNHVLCINHCKNGVPLINTEKKRFELSVNNNRAKPSTVEAINLQRQLHFYVSVDNKPMFYKLSMDLNHHGFVHPFWLNFCNDTKQQAAEAGTVTDVQCNIEQIDSTSYRVQFKDQAYNRNNNYFFISVGEQVQATYERDDLPHYRTYIFSVSKPLVDTPEGLQSVTPTHINLIRSLITPNVPAAFELLLRNENQNHTKGIEILPYAQDNKILNSAVNYLFTYVQGPPGTGKSYNAAELVHYIMANSSMRILIVGPSHKSVDELTWKIYNRLISSGRKDLSSTVQRYVSDNNPRADEVNVPQVCRTNRIGNKNRVFLCTAQSAIQLDLKGFDFVIFEECSMIADNQTVIILDKCIQNYTHVIFFGDPNQLGTVDTSRVRDKLPNKYSNAPSFNMITNLEKNLPYSIMLDVCYRCHPKITSLFSRLFYNSRVVAKFSERERGCDTDYYLGGEAIYFTDTGEGSGSVDPKNDRELEVLETVLNDHIAKTINGTVPKIFVICAYNSQVQKINSMKFNVPFHASTVDRTQGGEADIVIYLLTNLSSHSLSNRRVNVAISRAKSMLIFLVPTGESRLSIDEQALLDEMRSQTYLPVFNSLNATSHPQALVNLRKYSSRVDKLCEYVHSAVNTQSLPYSEHDAVAIDTEFINHSTMKDIAVYVEIGAHSKHGSRLLNGDAIMLNENDQLERFNIRDLIRNRELKAHLPRRPDLTEARKACLDRSYQAANRNQRQDPQIILELIKNHTRQKPLIVLWQGRNDLPYIAGFVEIELDPAKLKKCYKCGNPAVFAFRASYTCATHKHDQSLRALYNPSIVNIKLTDDITGDSNCFYVNDICVQGPKPSQDLTLQSAHDKYCLKDHGTAHNAMADAQMTLCLYNNIRLSNLPAFEKKYLHSSMANQPNRMYDREVCATRRQVLNRFFLRNKLRFCDKGGGRNPMPGATHVVDPILNDENFTDMNTHECDEPLDVYIDSIQYKDKPVSRPSLIFYDSNPDHYEYVGEKNDESYFIYNSSRGTKYLNRFPELPHGVRVYNLDITHTDGRTDFKLLQCSSERVAVDYQIDSPCCVSSGTTSTICKAHAEYPDIQLLAKLEEYGYIFALYGLTKIDVQAEFDPKTIMLKGYESRRRPVNNKVWMKQKALENIMSLDKWMCHNNKPFPRNAEYILAGASSHFSGLSAMGDYFISCFGTSAVFIDPRFSTTESTFYKCKLEEYEPKRKIQLLMCDIYDVTHEDRWLDNVLHHCENENFVVGGSLIFKVTCSFDNWTAVDKIASYFSYHTVIRPKILTNTTELWIHMYDYDRTPVHDNDLKSEFIKHMQCIGNDDPRYNTGMCISYKPKLRYIDFSKEKVTKV